MKSSFKQDWGIPNAQNALKVHPQVILSLGYHAHSFSRRVHFLIDLTMNTVRKVSVHCRQNPFVNFVSFPLPVVNHFLTKF